MAELFVERCSCGAERRPVDDWCHRCWSRFASPSEPFGLVSWRPPQLQRSRSSAGPLSLGLPVRLIITVPLALLVLRAWWGLAMHWGSVRLLLDVLWVPALSAMAVLWLRDLWETDPLDR